MSPGKPRVPYCEERPDAAHSRRDQMSIAGFAVRPGKPRVPYCEERPDAAHSRRDQMYAVGQRCAQDNRGSHTVRSGQVPHTPGGTKCMLWVSGVPKKTAGPTLRGAAKCRTLQEGPNKSCGLAVSPRKPRVPYCEERPGAAHSRRDQIHAVG